MGSAERGPGRGLALAASADWRVENLPAASQGGARRAIFRGLYKGAQAAAPRPGARTRGTGRAPATIAPAPGRLGGPTRPSSGLRPSPRCLVEPRAPGAGAPSEGRGVPRRHSGLNAAGPEVGTSGLRG